MKKIMIMVIAVIGSTCGFSQAQSNAIHNVSVTEFRKATDSLRDEVVVDLRTPDELKGGKIPGALEIDYFGAGLNLLSRR